MGESEVEKRIRKMKEEWALQAQQKFEEERRKNPTNDRKIEKSEKYPILHSIKGQLEKLQAFFNNLIR